jgi:hypothetical protein
MKEIEIKTKCELKGVLLNQWDLKELSVHF